MAATSSRTRSSGPVLRPMSPGRFCSTSHESAWSSAKSSFSSAFATSSSSFTSLPSSFHRSSSPTRVNMCGSSPPSPFAPSVRFSVNRSVSPSRSIAVTSPREQILSSSKKTCMCSPTTHPGSFRCSLHKNFNNNSNNGSHNYSVSNRLNARRSAMTNSLVRIGTVEGDLVKRALAALIRPSSHQQRRRAAFQPRPSRLSIMSRADDP
ncbi:hypothetical protein L1049_013249 [Liquidambar formosana]|uniref:Serine-rich protein-like protein n=1 Tax=Liquidambar formosana TaxID=63359 RepID=A0AAP0RKW4_LIQFO